MIFKFLFKLVLSILLSLFNTLTGNNLRPFLKHSNFVIIVSEWMKWQKSISTRRNIALLLLTISIFKKFEVYFKAQDTLYFLKLLFDFFRCWCTESSLFAFEYVKIDCIAFWSYKIKKMLNEILKKTWVFPTNSSLFFIVSMTHLLLSCPCFKREN